MNRTGSISYLPGLDGLRALAVVAVIVYHANKAWMPGGFLGVEVFFVISGYLITSLLLADFDAHGRIDLRTFWVRRARRLLPALWLLLIGVSVWASIFERETLGQLRGDVVAAFLYGFNWFQIWVGSSYFGELELVPLRHLWSLAVEEQFYLLWPIVIALLLAAAARRPRLVGWVLMGCSAAIAVYVAVVYAPGVPGSVTETPGQYLSLAGRPVLRLDFLFLGTLGRSGGLFAGAALAFWMPPTSYDPRYRSLDRHVFSLVGLLGLVVLGAAFWWMRDVVEGTLEGGTRGFDPLFRGGFFAVGLASLAVIAAATHPHTVVARWVLGNRILAAIGRRSYGLYLYHWPIFQFSRGVAGRALTPAEFAVLAVATVVVTECSYQFVERPIRDGRFTEWWRGARYPRLDAEFARRQRVVAIGAVLAVLPVFGIASVIAAPLQRGEIAQSIEDNETSVSTILPPLTSLAPDVTVDPSATTVPPSPEATTLDGQPIPILAIGDSVMLGAARELVAAGVTVDAVKSRPYRQALEIANYLRSVNRLGDYVIIHLGTNNRVEAETLDEIMVPLAEVDLVLFVTAHVPSKPWQDPNNELIRAMPGKYGNAKLLDWQQIASTNLGYLYKDRIHLTPEGARFYTDLIVQALGLSVGAG